MPLKQAAAAAAMIRTDSNIFQLQTCTGQHNKRCPINAADGVEQGFDG